MSIELVMPSAISSSVVPLLPLPSIFPSIRVFYNESVLHIGWPKYWSFSINPSLNIQGWFLLGLTGLISLLSGTLKSLLQHHHSKARWAVLKACWGIPPWILPLSVQGHPRPWPDSLGPVQPPPRPQFQRFEVTCSHRPGEQTSEPGPHVTWPRSCPSPTLHSLPCPQAAQHVLMTAKFFPSFCASSDSSRTGKAWDQKDTGDSDRTASLPGAQAVRTQGQILSLTQKHTTHSFSHSLSSSKLWASAHDQWGIKMH